jgi:hypothetical protein
MNGDLTNVKSDLVKAGRQIEVTVDPSKAAAVGLSAAQIAGEVRNLLVGSGLGQVSIDAEKVDLFVKVNSKGVNTLADLRNYIVGSTVKVPLSAVATVKEISVPSSITRIDQSLAANVSGEIVATNGEAVNVGAVNTAVKTAVTTLQDAGQLDSVSVRLAGVTEQQNESFSGLFLAMAVAILLVYLTMVIVFNSLVDPLVIMFSLPLAVIGAFPALLITNRPIGISALIGFLMLIGIVVTNAIVLLDRVEQLRHEGVPTREALLRAGATRVRPILMTAFSTIAGISNLDIGLRWLCLADELEDLEKSTTIDLAVRDLAALRREFGPEGGAEHHGELKSLGLVHGEHLDGVVIAIDTATEKVGRVLVVSRCAERREKFDERRGRCRTSARRALQQFGDVLEIGEVALSRRGCQHSTGQAVGAQRGHESGQTAGGEMLSPTTQAFEQC